MATYVKFSGMIGTSKEQAHLQWSEVKSISFSASRGNNTTNSYAGARPKVNGLEIVKDMDSASPDLFRAMMSGMPVQNATIEVCHRSGGKMVPNLAYALSDIIVMAYESAAHNPDANTTDPAEEYILLSFKKIEMKFSPYSEENKALSPQTVGYDVSEGRSI